MLVLSRKEGEVIRIGDDIKIEVTSIRGDKVRIGIYAPTNVAVHRQEVYDQVQAEMASKQHRTGLSDKPARNRPG